MRSEALACTDEGVVGYGCASTPGCAPSMSDLVKIRQRFADDVRRKADIRTGRLVTALASVPRERFLGAGPWHIGFFVGREPRYRISATSDPSEVYCDNVIAIDATRGPNNGEPSSLVRWIDALHLEPGDTVAHIGSGTGYYTALVAHTVGKTGRVIAYEIDWQLAGRATDNLSDYPWVAVVTGSTHALPERSVDAVFVNCGVTHPARQWLECLRDGGRLLLPLTASRPGEPFGTGAMYLVSKANDRLTIAYVSGVGIFNCTGQRDETLNRQLLSRSGQDGACPARSASTITYPPILAGCTVRRAASHDDTALCAEPAVSGRTPVHVFARVPAPRGGSFNVKPAIRAPASASRLIACGPVAA